MFTTTHDQRAQRATIWYADEIPFGIRALEQGHWVKGIVPASHYQAWLRTNSATTTPTGTPLSLPVSPIATPTYFKNMCEPSLRDLSTEDLDSPLPSPRERPRLTYSTPHPFYTSKGRSSPRLSDAAVQYTVKGVTPMRLENHDASRISGILTDKERGSVLTRWPYSAVVGEGHHKMSGDDNIIDSNHKTVSPPCHIRNSASTLPTVQADDGFGQTLIRRLEALAGDNGPRISGINGILGSFCSYLLSYAKYSSVS